MAETDPNETPIALTEEEAAARVEALKRVYDKGFLTHEMFEALRRKVEAGIKRTRRQPRGD
jgi:hypothetical protein